MKDIKLYVPVVTLSTQDNANLLQQLKSGTNYQSDRKTYAQNRYLNHLVGPSCQGVNRLFVLYLENKDDRKFNSNYYLPKVTIKDYNIMIDGKNIFDQSINGKFKTYENIKEIRKIKTSKQQALDTDPRAIQQISFSINLDRAGNTTMFLLLKK